MSNPDNKKTGKILGLFGLILCMQFCTCSDDDIKLARFDGGSVTVAEYVDRFIQSTQYKPEVMPSLENLNELVANKAMEQIVVLEARGRGLDQDADYKKELQERENLLLYQKFMKHEIIDRVITDSLINKFYREFSPQYQLGYILRALPPGFTAGQETAQKDTIEQIYQFLKKGRSFSELAKRFSQDLQSAPKGGDQGYIIFESLGDAAMRRTCRDLKEKSFSAPFRGVAGYYIVYIGDSRTVQIPTLQEVKERIWSTLYRTRRYDLESEADRRYHALQIDYHYHQDSVQIKAIQKKAFILYRELFESTQELSKIFSEDELQMVLGRFDGGGITVKELFLDRRKRPLDEWEFNKRIITLGQQKLFAAQARKARYDQLPEIRQEMASISEGVLRFAFYQREVKNKVAEQMAEFRRQQPATKSQTDLKTLLVKKSSELEKNMRFELEEKLKNSYHLNFITKNFDKAMRIAAEKKKVAKQKSAASAGKTN